MNILEQSRHSFCLPFAAPVMHNRMVIKWVCYLNRLLHIKPFDRCSKVALAVQLSIACEMVKSNRDEWYDNTRRSVT